MKIIIAQFAKAPQVGNVKTRMMPRLSAEQACQLHEILVTMVADRLSEFISTYRGQVELEAELWCSEQHAFLSELAQENNRTVKVQQGNNLGERMLNCVDDSLNLAEGIVLVGSDCPYLSSDYLNDAIERLCRPTIDVVIGPANDGGYVLLGLKRFCAPIFQGVDWSTDRVFAQTMDKIRHQQLVSYVLPALSDVDQPADLVTLIEHEPTLTEKILGLNRIALT